MRGAFGPEAPWIESSRTLSYASDMLGLDGQWTKEAPKRRRMTRGVSRWTLTLALLWTVGSSAACTRDGAGDGETETESGAETSASSSAESSAGESTASESSAESTSGDGDGDGDGDVCSGDSATTCASNGQSAYFTCAGGCSGSDTCDLDACEAGCYGERYQTEASCLSGATGCDAEATQASCTAACHAAHASCLSQSGCASSCSDEVSTCLAACG